MKSLYIFFMAAAAFVTCALAGGCVAVQYEELPPMPEYPPLKKTYDLSAAIEVLPAGNNAVEDLLREELRNNRYVNFSVVNYYRSVSAARMRLLSVLYFTRQLHQRPEGCYLDTRIIVSVREPGIIWNNQLNHRQARYFQAYSRIQLIEDGRKESVYQEGLQLAVKNLFLIGEFRNALEPGSIASEAAPGIVETPAGMWQKSLSYQHGQEANIYEALRWAYLAAHAGNKDALNYFISHAINFNICGNYRLLFSFLEKNAKSGHIQAAAKLGMMYENGYGVPADPVKAFAWYHQSAAKGDAAGVYHLARCYENGIGVEIDLTQAVYHYRIAAARGITAAAERLEALTE